MTQVHTPPPAVRTNTRPADSKPTGWTRSGWIWILLTSIAIVGFSVGQYFTANLADLAADNVGLAPNYADRGLPLRVAFYAHIVFGGAALLLGPWQFSTRLRHRLPHVHRWVGRVYLVAVGVAGVAGLIIAPVNKAGIVGVLGFGSLSCLWLFTAFRAWRTAQDRDYLAHQAWAVRGFALTYAAVTLRLWQGILVGIQLSTLDGPVTDAAFADAFDRAYLLAPFLCWVPNLIVAQWWVRRRVLTRRS